MTPRLKEKYKTEIVPKLEKGSPLSFTASLNALQRSCDQVVAMW